MNELTPTSPLSDAEIVAEATPESVAPARPIQLASFKRRAAAALIDLILLAIGLFLLALIMGNLAFRLGIWGRLVGLIAITLYLGWGNSERMRGQTIGKRITKIAVVDEKGVFLPLSRSLVRSFMLASLLLLIKGGVPFLNWPLLLNVLAIAGVALTFTMVYAYIFNRTRQGIHDVVAKSYVVQSPLQGNEFPRPRPNFWQEAFVVSVAGIVLMTICNRSALGLITDDNNINISGLSQLYTLLSEQEHVSSVQVQHLFTRRNNAPVETWLVITIWSTELCRGEQAQAQCLERTQEYGALVLANYGRIGELEGLQIAIQNQFDFLIATGQWAIGDRGSIAYWQEKSGIDSP